MSTAAARARDASAARLERGVSTRSPKETVTLDGVNTAATVRARVAVGDDAALRPGAHRAAERRRTAGRIARPKIPRWCARARSSAERRVPTPIARMADEIARATRPVDPWRRPESVGSIRPRFAASSRPWVRLVFATPKAKGIFPEDHPQFFGASAAGSAGRRRDRRTLHASADLLIGVGFDPVESDKVWHQTMKLVPIAPVSDRRRPSMCRRSES